MSDEVLGYRICMVKRCWNREPGEEGGCVVEDDPTPCDGCNRDGTRTVDTGITVERADDVLVNVTFPGGLDLPLSVSTDAPLWREVPDA